MADLITNLQSIYNTKLQIKEAIGTESDIFADYPSYISDLKPEGYTYITMNGDHSVNGYAYVNVAVPGATEYDHIDISANSQVDVSAYNYAYVSVPVPPGYIIPEGTINIETVGTHDVTAYASAYVDIQVPTYVFGYQTITNNGVAYASTYGLDGFTYVDVNVSGGGGSSHSGTSAVDAWTVDEAISYISAFEDTAEHLYTDLGFTPYVEGVVAAVRNTRSAQYPSARYTITRTGESIAADYSNAIICWNINPAWGQQSWTEGVDRQVKVGDHVIIAADKLQKYYDSNNNVYQMEFKNGAEVQAQSEVANTLSISQSGTYDVQSYVSAYVDVQGGGGSDTLSVTGVWMANAISDGVNTYQMMNTNNTLSSGLDSYSFGTYVAGNIISIWSQDCLTKYQSGSEIYCEDYDLNDYSSNIVATAGTFNWDATNQVVNPSGGFYWSEQHFGWITRKNYNFTDDLGTTYRISAYDYNTYNSTTANLIINWWEDPNDPGQRYAAIVGTDA